MGNINFWLRKDKKIDEVKANSHFHNNKSTLDKISQSSLDTWDNKQTTQGDLKDNITTFTQSETRTNIVTGEKLSSTLGKVSKFLFELKALSFKDKVEKNDLESDLILEIEDKYTKNEVDNKFSTLESNLDWKESVSTFDDIAIEYPSPQDGWTVNVMDTNFTFRYNGSEWIAISANAIPKATQAVDGLLTKEDKKILDDNKNSRHNHSNKNILDTITQSLLTNWNSAYTHISDTVKHITSDERTKWNNKVDKVAGKDLSSNDFTSAEKTKLASIASNANNYVHPISHPASIITQDATHRFVTDTEKSKWNDTTATKFYDTKATDSGRIQLNELGQDNIELEIATADNGNEPIVARQYLGVGKPPFSEIKRTFELLDKNGNTNVPGILNAVGGFKYNGVGLDSRYLKAINMPSNYNLNTVTEQGIYYAVSNNIANSITGHPFATAFSVICINVTSDNSRTVPTVQLAFCYIEDRIKMRRRKLGNLDEWYDWFEIITDKNSSQFAKAGLINSSHDKGLNYIEKDRLPTEFPIGLNVYSIYNSKFPCAYGNLLSIKLREHAATQLFLEWKIPDKARGRILYRNSRDTGVDEFSEWGRLVEADELETLEPKQPITTITKSLKLTTEWADTGINLNYPTGTYILQVTIADNKIFYNTVLSGIMSITQVSTNTNTDSDKNEIHLHCAAHATSNITIHLRSCGHICVADGGSGITSLQIKYSGQPIENRNMANVTHQITFKFKKII